MTDDAGQHPGVDVGYARNARFLQQDVNRNFGAPVARHRLVPADDESVDIGNDALEIVARNAVVADERIRHRDDLPAIRRVRQHFLITGDAGVEHHFADDGSFRPERAAGEQRAVLQQQSCLHPYHSLNGDIEKTVRIMGSAS